MANIEVIYSDVNLAAGIEPRELVVNSDSINQNIANIFDTPKKSKWHRPRVGSDINRHLFEPIDDLTAERIKYDMARALDENGEHRLIINQVIVLPDPENAQYYVEIRYSAPELEAREFSFQFNLSRGFG